MIIPFESYMLQMFSFSDVNNVLCAALHMRVGRPLLWIPSLLQQKEGMCGGEDSAQISVLVL